MVVVVKLFVDRGVNRFDHNSYKSRELGRVTNMLKHTLNLDKNAELKLESPCTCTFCFDACYLLFILCLCMSVKSSTELMLYVVLTMPTLNKAYLLLF
jgi:hypothetical protein